MPQLGPQYAEAFLNQFMGIAEISAQLEKLRGSRIVEMSSTQQRRPRISIAGLVREIFLSTRAVLIQDVPLFSTGTEPSAAESPQKAWSSQAFKSSPSTARIQSSPPPSEAAAEPQQRAFQRLQLLAPSLDPGAMATRKKPTVLSYLPTERGVDTSDYVSSVAMANERRFDDARQRVQRMEAKRKAHSEKYRRPAFMRQGFPEAESSSRAESKQPVVHHSGPRSSPQPGMSSQSQGPFGSLITMSQPAAGPFGDRKKVKKVKKKKSGFR